MLYYNFSNVYEFRERFGLVTRSNGTVSRNNKILLAYIKDRSLLHQCRLGQSNLINIPSMAELYDVLKHQIKYQARDLKDESNYNYMIFEMGGDNWRLASSKMKLDHMAGICEDGDARCIRYINTENGRTFKMKSGKFFHTCVIDMHLDINETVLNWLCEEFARNWEAYANTFVPEYSLHVDRDFEAIYSYNKCASNFGSCMMDENRESFYRCHTESHAAYLTNTDDEIVARCIIFDHVRDDETGKFIRLAERQYATNGDEMLKRILINKLIEENYIDGYKKIGAGCHLCANHVQVNGFVISQYIIFALWNCTSNLNERQGCRHKP